MGFWFRPVILWLGACVNQLRGREMWEFNELSVVSPFGIGKDGKRMYAKGEMRAGLFAVNRRWAIGLSNDTENVTIGPFASKSVAQAFEQDLRHRRRPWFTTGDGEELVYGLPSPPVLRFPRVNEPVVSFKFIPAGNGVRLLLDRRPERIRPYTVHYFLWLAFWAFGEVAAVLWLIHAAISQTLPHVSGILMMANSVPWRKVMYVSCWLAFWTFAGAWVIFLLSLRFRTQEWWELRDEEIVSGPTWRFPRRRKLSGDIHARRLQSARGLEIEMIVNGRSLLLGPFADEAMASAVHAELRRFCPRWKWVATDPPLDRQRF